MYLQRDDEVCLAKKQKKIGAGKLNGVGGKLKKGETPATGAVRETEEELSVRPTVYKKMAELLFHNEYDGDGAAELQEQLCHVFVATEWEGEPAETETGEMKDPAWYKINNLPFERMLPDDEVWFPRVLSGIAIKASFSFDKDWNITHQKIEEVKGF
jgi:8-oxo-dGTP diphosphatase